MPYELQAGRMATWALEAHIVDHCNLRCEQCCSLSPQVAPRLTSPQALERDLRAAARVVAPAVFKITGGEPSLHPELAACVAAARESGISRQISMTTNGLLATSLPDDVFRLLDRITLSVYASAPPSPETLAFLAQRCDEFDVRLTVKPIGVFQVMTPARPGDAAHARRVFASCWLKIRCHMVHEGRLYPCTRPPHVVAAMSRAGLSEAWDTAADGVDLGGERDEVLRGLAQRLEGQEPLQACRWCLGATGEWQVHRQKR